MGDDGRRGSRSQELSHFPFHNDKYFFDGDWRSRYLSQTIPSPSNHLVDIGISLGFSIHFQGRSVHRSQTRQFSAYNHGRLYIAHPRFPQEAIRRSTQG